MKKSQKLVYKSFCWCLGTTSFRTKNFNRKIEEQLSLLKSFFENPENNNQNWEGNSLLQEHYYLYMKKQGFVSGNAQRKDKDARQKTSGLVFLGLIDSNRRITSAGQPLLNITKSKDFHSDNFLQIPKDSFIYLKQLLKTTISVDKDTVRPLIVLLYLLSEFEYLTYDEFTYLLPLCTNKENTEHIKQQIKFIRKGEQTIDNVIISTLLSKENYKIALQYFLKSKTSDNVICAVGMNRKSHTYDLPYATLYKELRSVFLKKQTNKIPKLLKSLSTLNIGHLWKSYLFKTQNRNTIINNPQEHINDNLFLHCEKESDFKTAFFKIMHLLKAKATLLDYLDLNRRYIKTTDIFLFEDCEIRLDIVPKHFFKQSINKLYLKAFDKCTLLHSDCNLKDISPALIYNEQQILNDLNNDLNETISTIDEANFIIEKKRYERFNRIISNKFNDRQLITLLEKFEKRDDDAINNIVTDNADIPTIFEYILGIIWYKISNKQGKILDFLKLSLDANLLPVTHAAGGEADIVYEYKQTSDYPKHTLLLEATLADGTNQRIMEMEPVSRHLGNHLLNTQNMKSYCIFVSKNLNINLISDFRGRKNSTYYDNKNPDIFIKGMKIIPLEISDLKNIILQKKKYSELYKKFEIAFYSTEPHAKKWYDTLVRIKQ